MKTLAIWPLFFITTKYEIMRKMQTESSSQGYAWGKKSKSIFLFLFSFVKIYVRETFLIPIRGSTKKSVLENQQFVRKKTQKIVNFGRSDQIVLLIKIWKIRAFFKPTIANPK